MKLQSRINLFKTVHSKGSTPLPALFSSDLDISGNCVDRNRVFPLLRSTFSCTFIPAALFFAILLTQIPFSLFFVNMAVFLNSAASSGAAGSRPAEIALLNSFSDNRSLLWSVSGNVPLQDVPAAHCRRPYGAAPAHCFPQP